MSDFKPSYTSEFIEIHEWPFGCEVIEKSTSRGAVISSPEDARAVIVSLNDYLNCIPKECGGNKE